MDVADLLREMNEEFTKGQVEVVKLEAFDYLTRSAVQIQVSINKYTFKRSPMVPVRLTREFNTDPGKAEDNLDAEDHNLRSQGVIYRRSRDEEVRAREDFVLHEKSRIQERIALARPRDKQECLKHEIDNYNTKRTVDDFNALIRIYNASYPTYGTPNEWWLDEVYANNIILDWLDKLASEGPIAIECKGLATFLYHRTGFRPPGKNNLKEWEKVLKRYSFLNVFTPATLGAIYNKMSKKSNRLDPDSDKNLLDALRLFEAFPDEEGLTKLQAEIEERKKGTVPG